MRAITVKELIKALKLQDQNAQVAVAEDCEGNGFSLIPNEQFVSKGFMSDELGYNDFEDEQIENTKPTVVIWGSN